MTRRKSTSRRSAITLLEVIVSLAIFLFALVAIGRLITLGSDRAVDVNRQSWALLLCQSKLAEIVAGVEPLSSQTDVPCEEDPTWLWSVECTQGDFPGLWTVQVWVRKEGTEGPPEASLSQMVFDPAQRGNASDQPAASTTTTTTTTPPTTSGM
jgi:type II secretion system protein I